MLGKKRVLQVAEAGYRALNEQREKRGEKRNLQDVALGLDFFPIHIDDIAHRLEGVERYAQRQHPVHGGDIGRKQRVEVKDDEVCVLQCRKDAEVDQKCEHKHTLALFLLKLFILLALRA